MAPLAIKGAINWISNKKLHQEFDLESLKDRWLWRLCYLHEIVSVKMPPYLYEIIPPLQRSQHNPGCFKPLRCQTELFQNSFLPFTISEWNILDPTLEISTLIRYFARTFSFYEAYWEYFLEILQGYCKLVILGTLGMPGYAHPEWHYQPVENFRVSLQAKNHIHPPRFSRKLQRYANLLFSVFRACLAMHTQMIVSTCRKLRCLFACQK